MYNGYIPYEGSSAGEIYEQIKNNRMNPMRAKPSELFTNLLNGLLI
jgi:hypothetical protein